MIRSLAKRLNTWQQLWEGGTARFYLIVLATLLSLGTIGMFPQVCLAHGATCDVIEGGIAVEARYDDGSPMAYCDVEIFRPGEAGEAFQVGSTDPMGRFAFIPDTTGTWTATVDDGMGHLARAEIAIGPDAIMARPTGISSKLRGTIIGVAVIFGVFGLLALFYGLRRRGKRGATPCT
jgi:nickel transport protein